MQTINYKSVITSARAAARDILRTEKVSALLGYIRNQKAKIKQAKTRRDEIVKRHEEAVKAQEATVAQAAYNLKLATDTGNPEVETFQKAYDKAVARKDEFLAKAEISNARELEDYDAQAAETVKAAEEKIAEYEGKITAWQDGTSKVCFEDMVALANSLVRGRVTDAFNEGEYDDVTDEDDSADSAETPAETA